jgi:hypothetical protein
MVTYLQPAADQGGALSHPAHSGPGDVVWRQPKPVVPDAQDKLSLLLAERNRGSTAHGMTRSVRERLLSDAIHDQLDLGAQRW